MKNIDVDHMKEKFLKYANGSDFPESLFQWHEFDFPTMQAFIWVEGKWDDDIKDHLQAFLKVGFNRKILISRVLDNGGAL